MENKYYTPALEDLRVGYECEIFDDRLQDPNNIQWIKVTLDDLHDVAWRVDDKNWNVRTPYLTKEQIEAEGWELINVLEHSEESHESSWYQFKKGKYEVRWWGQPDYIEFYNSRSKEDLIYEGKCPSINEFRTTCKLLGI